MWCDDHWDSLFKILWPLSEYQGTGYGFSAVRNSPYLMVAQFWRLVISSVWLRLRLCQKLWWILVAVFEETWSAILSSKKLRWFEKLLRASIITDSSYNGWVSALYEGYMCSFFFLNFHLCYFRSGLLSRCEMQVFSRIRWFDQIVVADLLAILRAGSSWRFECCLWRDCCEYALSCYARWRFSKNY
jgi:hypothetical protein